MPKGRKKKTPFADLDQDFQDLINNMSDEEIRNKITEVSKNQSDLMKAKAEDQDLKEKQELVKGANYGYKEGTKFNRLRIEYALYTLENRGKV